MIPLMIIGNPHISDNAFHFMKTECLVDCSLKQAILTRRSFLLKYRTSDEYHNVYLSFVVKF